MKPWQTALIAAGATGAAGVGIWYWMYRKREQELPPEAGPLPVAMPPPSSGSAVTGYVKGSPSTFPVESVGNGQVLRSDAAQAFLAMKRDAQRAGIALTATSGFRTNEQQQKLYDGYMQNLPGFNMAAKPGYSNHQSGISVDIGGVGGFNTPAYSWLKSNASRYGFVNDVRGEYWHWTFKGGGTMAVSGVTSTGLSGLGAVDAPSMGTGALLALVGVGAFIWFTREDEPTPESECEAAARRWKKTCLIEKKKKRTGASTPASSPAESA